MALFIINTSFVLPKGTQFLELNVDGLKKMTLIMRSSTIMGLFSAMSIIGNTMLQKNIYRLLRPFPRCRDYRRKG